ncbi:Sec-independent protein translocase protein TatB [Brevundimonas sp.]|uniref:Sec-independent protein translocase protein TatB n=1 Tax=Brevundimonas sp. TaxID=1871086 RepID=UPI003459D819
MGGLGPGLGGTEILVIGLVALLVVGPKDLPVLMRKLGKLMGKARGMANEFRASFDEMARQSELDELRKEVEALRSNQGIHALGADADAAFREIGRDLDSGLAPSPVPTMTPAPDEWPDAGPAMMPLAAPAEPDSAPPIKTGAKAKAPVKARVSKASKPAASKAAAKPTAASRARAAARPRAVRTKKAEL